MGRVISPESEEGKELAKWEQFPANWNGNVVQAGNPYVYRPFPKMLYKATKREDGRIVCLESEPAMSAFLTMDSYQREVARVHAHNASACLTVGSADEMERAVRQGWVEGSPLDAIARLKAFEDEIANAAAEANAKAVGMTDKARRERNKRESATDEHVPE